ncbi:MULTISPECIES: hypothetical protein [unclassified Pseudomonas]|uniref:hypothetical protein n=1 Tax=unclassified Pseudomonas TaxID=196821 RepID=UPI002113C295|nr:MULTISPECIES: hypothetical protein [unclassified Pseudomonas]
MDTASTSINTISSVLRAIQRFSQLDDKPLAAPIHAYRVTVRPTVDGTWSRSAEICDNMPMGANSEVTIVNEATHSTLTAHHIRKAVSTIGNTHPCLLRP